MTNQDQDIKIKNMLSSIYVEDIFLAFCDLVRNKNVPVQPHDYSILGNFELVLLEKKQITQNQANFLIKILRKYQTFSNLHGLDYKEAIDDPHWKQEFRILDLSKKIFVIENEDKEVWVCLRFPFQLKKEFDQEFSNDQGNFLWDPENKVRRNRLYDCNLISLYEFCQKHNFEIDDSFLTAMAQVEEIWQFQDSILHTCSKKQGRIVLNNASEDAQNYFNQHSLDTIEDDLLLAKSMGFKYVDQPKNLIERIAYHDDTEFWIKDPDEYFSLIASVKGKIVIVLERVTDFFSWLQDFSQNAEKHKIPTKDIKICFREDKESTTGFNDWVKNKGYGGKIEEGRIFIFLQKPAKWLFNDINSVKIVTSTNLYPSPNPIMRDFCNNHSCVIYLGQIRPSEKKDQRIVEL